MWVEYFCTALTLKRDKRAVTSIEYAILASLVAVVIVVAVMSVGAELPLIFNNISTEL
jgi:Flp pilus assembly pilin Flp